MSTAAPGKRPAIRLKATTPPRASGTTESSVVVVRHRLPPPRTPARRVLQIVADEESHRSLHALAPPHAAPSADDSQARAVVRPIWKRPEVILAALAAFGTVLGIVLALVSSRTPATSTAANEAPIARTELRKGQEAPASKPASPEVRPSQPQIPTFDVKSLPPARR